MFALRKKLVVTLQEEVNTVDIYVDGECIAYFDEEGLNLLPECGIMTDLPIDEEGYIKLRRCP